MNDYLEQTCFTEFVKLRQPDSTSLTSNSQSIFCAVLLLQPLTSLVKKSAVFVWEKDKQDAFQQAKRALLNAVTLQHPSPTAQIKLNTDASGTHIEATLMQRENREQPWFPATFYSKGLNSAQRRYSTLDRELLAVFLSVKAVTSTVLFG